LPRVDRAAGPHGLLLLDKPEGASSAVALGQAKRLVSAGKAGHTGTLDPFASGLLPLALGEATKFSRFLLDASKSYLATLKLGERTATGDTEGEVVETRPVAVSEAQVEPVLANFLGQQAQTPPMHSAIRHQGRRLYDLARQGIEVERTPREITIEELHLLRKEADLLEISVKCSKGTYIRVLAEDIGERLGCGAHLIGLRRTGIGQLSLAQAISLEALERLEPEQRRRTILPVRTLVAALPLLALDNGSAKALLEGRRVEILPAPAKGLLAVESAAGTFFGVVESDGSGRLVPGRMASPGFLADFPDFLEFCPVSG
jgi:tRNA pseudouridine55 synthase